MQLSHKCETERLERQAEEMFSRLVKQLSERLSITEQLKAEHQLEWVVVINNIRNSAMEIANYENHDLIYV